MQEETKLWKKLWAIVAPGKMKITLWRFSHDCLPSGQQLVHRNIPAAPTCIVCGRFEEAAHTLLFCQYAKEVWAVLKAEFAIKLGRKKIINPKAWIFEFLSRSEARDCTVLAVAFWFLWENRNGVRNGKLMKHPNALAEQIKTYVHMIEVHLRKPSSTIRCDSSFSMFKWTPPPVGSVLINVDAALFKSSNRMGVGVVIRSHNGECLAACSELINEVTSPELAEALAIRRALALAREEGFDKIMVASDCLSVVHRINNSTQDRSFLGVVIEDIKKETMSFTSYSFFHIPRKCNESTHVLAKRSELSGNVRFCSVAPDCIRDILCNDLI
jgi:ribonuclease HI